MAVALYRSLRFEETQRIEEHKLSKEKVYLGTPKPIEEFALAKKIHAYEGIDNHIRNGNSGKNKEIYSITEDFLVALKFAKPITVIKDNEVVHVKINRSAIAVFNGDGEKYFR
ncbi:hypothetical protein [Viridibacillus arvi]|uniref:hypothetical protein n=1 Tax=Viridibacillus arvi TaxID=263475 RepID=UPI003D054251